MANRCGLWFGTIGRMQWVRTPNAGADMSPMSWGAEGTFLNGGGYVRNAWSSHREYTFEWPDSSSREAAALMQAYRNGTYGRGLIYFIDPLIYDQNILPARWADPSMAIGDEGAPHVYGVYPEGVVTSGSAANNLPVRSAYYNISEIAPGYRGDHETLFVPIPEGYTLYLGAFYQATGSGAVFAAPVDSNGSVGTSVALTSVGNTSGAILPDSFSGGAGVRLWIGKSSAGSASVTLAGMVARLIETRDIGQVRTNLFTNPSFETTDGTVEVRRNLTHEPIPTTGASWATTGNSPVGSVMDGWYRTSGGGAIASHVRTDLEPSHTYSVRLKIRASEPIPLSVQFRPNTGSTGAVTVGTITADVGEQEYVFTGSAPDEVTTPRVTVLALSMPAGGGYFEVTEVTTEKGDTVGPFFAPGLPSPDPDLTPEWTGPPDGSPSILTAKKVKGIDGGYQSGQWAASGESSWFLPELENVAPGFVGYQQGEGSQTVDIGGTLVDRTLYVVGDVIDTDSNNAYWAQLGVIPSTGRILMHSGPSGGSGLRGRVDTSNGSSVLNITFSSGSRSPGRHLAWAGTADGMAVAQGNADSPTALTDSLTPGDGMEASPALIVGVLGSSDTPIAAVAYRGAHTEEQRTAVLGWLHARYMHELLDNQTFLITPRHDGQIVYFNGQEIVTQAGVPVRVYGSGYVGLSPGWWDNQLVTDGDYSGDYFDGNNNPNTNRYVVGWTGSENDSPSTLTTAAPLNFRSGPWSAGLGHSGCKFVGNPTYVANNGINGGRVGYAATFKEVGDWV